MNTSSKLISLIEGTHPDILPGQGEGYNTLTTNAAPVWVYSPEGKHYVTASFSRENNRWTVSFPNRICLPLALPDNPTYDQAKAALQSIFDTDLPGFIETWKEAELDKFADDDPDDWGDGEGPELNPDEIPTRFKVGSWQ